MLYFFDANNTMGHLCDAYCDSPFGRPQSMGRDVIDYHLFGCWFLLCFLPHCIFSFALVVCDSHDGVKLNEMKYRWMDECIICMGKQTHIAETICSGRKYTSQGPALHANKSPSKSSISRTSV